MELIQQGKVKDVFAIDPKTLLFFFTNRISVFDQIIPTEIQNKGATLCLTAAYWFKKAQDMGILTHFLEMESQNSMKVKRVRIIRDYSKISTSTANYLIPLEVIARYYVAGSLFDRMTGKKKPLVRPEDIGFPPGHQPKLGEKLPKPMVEVTTKLEKVDRDLTLEEALKISGLTQRNWEQMRDIVLKIDERINREVSRRGLIHVDGKKEFAMDDQRRLMLVDTFGTADEDRWWDSSEYAKGNLVELSKEFVRQYYKRIGHHANLMVAREKGLEELPIPPLPQNVAEETSKIYIKLYEMITGERFVSAKQ